MSDHATGDIPPTSDGQPRRVEEWTLPANCDPAEIGNKIVLLTMENPRQVFRIFRADEHIIIAAVEGERWEPVETPQD